MKPLSGKQRGYLQALLAVAVTAAVYLPLLNNRFLLWDDDEYILENIHIQHVDWSLVKWAFTAFVAGNWHPVSSLSLAVDFAVWGMNPVGHHLFDLVIHLSNTFLVSIIVIQLLDIRIENVRPGEEVPPSLGQRGRQIAALVTALLFGIHPLHVESVAWASERKDLLCGLFFLLTILTYTKSARHAGRPSGDMCGFWRRSCLPAFCFSILAMMSKPMAVTLPLVLLLFDWYPLRRVGSFKEFAVAMLEKLPFLLLSLMLTIITIIGQRSSVFATAVEIPTLWDRILISTKATALYLVKMIVPLDLSPIYPYPRLSEITVTSRSYLLSLFLVSAVSILCIITIKKPRLWQAAWLYYLITLIPVIGIVQFGYQSMADRFTYLPLLAIFLLAGTASARLWALVSGRAALQRVVAVTGIGLAAGLSFLTVKQILVWRDNSSFWTSIIAKEPQRIPFAYINRGLAYREKKELSKALADLDRAVALAPNDFKAFNSRGLVLADMGEHGRAIADFNRAIALFPKDPSAYFNRGSEYWKIGEDDRALADFSTVISMKPDDLKARNNMGLVYQGRREFDRALAEYNGALAVRPDDWMTLNNRGLLLSAMGASDQAIVDFDNALRQKPDESSIYVNRGLVFRAKGMDDKALSDFERAVRLEPDDSRAYNNRALIHAAKGELTDAVADFTTALKFDPSLSAVYLNRGIILSRIGDVSRARKDFEKACEMGEQRGCGLLR